MLIIEINGLETNCHLGKSISHSQMHKSRFGKENQVTNEYHLKCCTFYNTDD